MIQTNVQSGAIRSCLPPHPPYCGNTHLLPAGIATKASPSRSDTLGTSPTFPTSTLLTPYFIMFKIWLQGLM